MMAPKNGIKPFDLFNLYRIERYTDTQHGDVVALTPVTQLGDLDPSRPVRYRASVRLQFMGDARDMAFEIKGATSLADAMRQYPAEAEKFATETAEKLKSEYLRRSIEDATLPDLQS